MNLVDELLTALRALDGAEIDYAVCGALALHGAARATTEALIAMKTLAGHTRDLGGMTANFRMSIYSL